VKISRGEARRSRAERAEDLAQRSPRTREVSAIKVTVRFAGIAGRGPAMAKRFVFSAMLRALCARSSPRSVYLDCGGDEVGVML
jgi:hypothetical protein